MSPSLERLFDQYAGAHQDPRNKLCHRVGIPLIAISVVVLLASAGEASWAWWLFGVGWAFQFVGHTFERTWPEFMKNPVFLLIGPLYFVRELFKKSH
jgi:uncharacterized membrane protein YGL010W